MPQFQMPITIYQAMERIRRNDYILPAFQREFVWKSEQIEKLFDSLMRKYPTSSMLFWKINGTNTRQWKFYKFIDSFVLGAKDYSITNQLYDFNTNADLYAILDGQQRLTAIRLGLYGTYSYHEPYRSWNYDETSFPKRHLYLNLSRQGGQDDDCLYFFNFKKDIDTGNQTFYYDNEENLWFKVGAIIPYNESGEYISDFFSDVQLTRDQRRIIQRLWNTIFTDLSITYYEEDDSDYDKAVQIFTRINSGGTFLSFSDIIFSLIVSNWENLDAKKEMTDLKNSITQKGFEIGNDYLVKCFLYLYSNSIKTEIKTFNKEFCRKIEDNWNCIKGAILSLFDTLQSFGLSSFTLTSNNATLPILYYIYHKNIYTDFTNKIAYKEDRKEIKRWLLGAVLRKTFGAQSDSTLQQTRKIFTEEIGNYFIKPDINNFDGEKINEHIKNLDAIDDAFLDDILSVQKDNCYAFPILSLLYPDLDYKNNNFHKDHLHAADLYKNLDFSIQERFPWKTYNSIINLQMLNKNENESKGNKLLFDWVNDACKGQNEAFRQQFLENHLIPNVDLSLNNLEVFFSERKRILKTKLKSILLREEVN